MPERVGSFDDEALLRAYLLGTLAEPGRIEIEIRLLSDRYFFEAAQALEGDLLADFAAGRLDAPEAQSVRRWLAASPAIRGRYRLVQDLARKAAATALRPRTQRAAPAPEDAAFERLRNREMKRFAESLEVLRREGLAAWEIAPPGLNLGLAGYEALLARSWELRGSDLQGMVDLAKRAVQLAGALPPERYGAPRVADWQARAHVELATALRRSTALAEAEASLARAVDLLAQGTGSELLQARFLTVRGCLHGDQLRYPECYEAVDAAAAIYLRLGDDHNRGQSLAIKAAYASQKGDLDEVAAFLREALPLIDERKDPYLGLAVTHNLVHGLAYGGRFAEARALLAENAWRYAASATPVDLAKRWALEGVIAGGLGEGETALQCFLESKRGYEELGDAYHVGIVCVDLGSLYLELGQTDAARRMALEAAGIFRTLSISEEALAAVRLLEEIGRAEVQSALKLRHVADFLRQAEGDPKAKLKPL